MRHKRRLPDKKGPWNRLESRAAVTTIVERQNSNTSKSTDHQITGNYQLSSHWGISVQEIQRKLSDQSGCEWLTLQVTRMRKLQMPKISCPHFSLPEVREVITTINNTLPSAKRFRKLCTIGKRFCIGWSIWLPSCGCSLPCNCPLQCFLPVLGGKCKYQEPSGPHNFCYLF